MEIFGVVSEISNLKVYAEPNADIYIEYDYEKNEINYSGTLQNENNLLRQYKFDLNRVNALANDFSRTKASPSIIYQGVIAERDKVLENFEITCMSNKVSPKFVNLVRWDILYAYATIFNRIVINNCSTQLRDQIVFPMDWEVVWKKNIGNLAISNEEAVGCESYLLFALDGFLFHAYMMKYQNKINEKIYPIQCDNFPLRIQRMKQLFKGKSYEMMLIYDFQFLIMRNEKCVLPYSEIFKTENVNSSFIPYLDKKLQPIRDLTAHSGKEFSADMHIIETEGIDSLAQLFEKFKGKIIFGDIWATWCSPCKEEFGQKKDLEVFAKEKDIVLLYISVDKSERDELWKTMIKRYDLTGYNIRINENLERQLTASLGSLTFPKYFIIDKTGKIVVYNAPRPSRKEELFELFKKYL